MRLDRRNFLKGLGLTLFSLGVVDRQFRQDIHRYAYGLEKFSGRKFACLIGVNSYPDVEDLAGCTTDLSIQKQLLIHRFGFSPDQILVLENEAATRDNIFTAFQKKLRDFVTPEDFLLVHFSGYGTRIKNAQAESVPAIMPVDGVVGQAKAVVNNAIAVSTLQGLIRSLNVAQSVLVLDTDFQTSQTQQNQYLRRRVYPRTSMADLGANPSETAIADQLELNARQRQLIDKEILTLSASRLGGGREFTVNGLYAGLFTVTLAQYLAGVNPRSTVADAEKFAEFRYRQLRLLPDQSSASTAATLPLPLYGILPTQLSLPNAGHVVSKSGAGVELSLLGYSPEILQAIAPDSAVVTVEAVPKTLTITTKKGFAAQAKTTDVEPQPDTPLQEKLRIYPRNLTLHIALSSNLSRIERVDATSAFAGLPGVTAVSNPMEWADYIFDTGYNLYSLGGQPLPARVPIESKQAIKSSVEDLQPALGQLLALKWLRLLLNETSSKLATEMCLVPPTTLRSPLLQKITPADNTQSPPFQTVTLSTNQALQFQLKNLGDRPLNFVGLAVDAKQEIILLTPQGPLQVLPNDTVLSEVKYHAQRPPGQWQVYWIGSSKPLTEVQTLCARQFINLETATVKLTQSLLLMQALLNDLNMAPPTSISIGENPKETYQLDVENWLGACFTYEVTENSPKVN